MQAGRLNKALQRRLTIMWRDQPSQSDIEELAANVERVGLVIRLRWAIVAAIAAFSVFGIGIYALAGQAPALAPRMVIPAGALLLVLVYNAYYQRTYRSFGNLAAFNAAALVLDILVVTVLVYYSGGVYSWFDALYYLFVLEAALILPNRREVWGVAGLAAIAYSLVVSLVYWRVLPHMAMPFVRNDLQLVGSYVAVRALWTLTVILGSASVGLLFTGVNRERMGALAKQSVRDIRTGLYDRAYLRRELSVEIERARRFRRGASVIIADIDDFAHFNEVFGTEAGNRMIDLIAGVVREASGCQGGEPCLVLAARYGGEEFALLLPEDAESSSEEGELMAARLRAGVASVLDDDRSVTVSVGVAAYSRDGRTASELLSAADAALVRAAAEGGNRVVVGRSETTFE
ncbi:MAG TPA: GGDEF domain-containing protein [Coriobacteriia bacterium]